MIKVISVRETPAYKDIAIRYLQQSWPDVYPIIYEDAVSHSIGAAAPLPQWYLLEKEGEVIGCAGLITNDFISRVDLYPWICAIYIAEAHRGHRYAQLLIEKAKADTARAGFTHLYLSTDHIGYYERYGFAYIGQGYHPWEESSRIYGISVQP
ncbi:GNAT family N-acetyltransferase [Chitinophaga nivalis]|uniref:GNAT family N-acetyltransferase n=1 Tax=Chitinophaga nivalis TaxID=2991709 RepID=A0ABT3IJY0_9BACT|nr:GNAT family N-acetyltransferase [Chitinophaga nivalis]MCW3466038.1 GNAT family N-acetyltransferase [Chitinophaga nivalis]MCW3484271.1 GNAT family N-acetyltransferase [Chitinophaga nivalis]